jgi:hypothetical protein
LPGAVGIVYACDGDAFDSTRVSVGDGVAASTTGDEGRNKGTVVGGWAFGNSVRVGLPVLLRTGAELNVEVLSSTETLLST